MRVAYTPGHASHHVCYLHEESGTAFVGDVAAVPDPAVRPDRPPHAAARHRRRDLGGLDRTRRRLAPGAPRPHPLRRDRGRRPSTWRRSASACARRPSWPASSTRTPTSARPAAPRRASSWPRRPRRGDAAELLQAVPTAYQWRGLDRYWRKRGRARSRRRAPPSFGAARQLRRQRRGRRAAVAAVTRPRWLDRARAGVVAAGGRARARPVIDQPASDRLRSRRSAIGVDPAPDTFAAAECACRHLDRRCPPEAADLASAPAGVTPVATGARHAVAQRPRPAPLALESSKREPDQRPAPEAPCGELGAGFGGGDAAASTRFETDGRAATRRGIAAARSSGAARAVLGFGRAAEGGDRDRRAGRRRLTAVGPAGPLRHRRVRARSVGSMLQPARRRLRRAPGRTRSTAMSESTSGRIDTRIRDQASA